MRVSSEPPLLTLGCVAKLSRRKEILYIDIHFFSFFQYVLKLGFVDSFFPLFFIAVKYT